MRMNANSFERLHLADVHLSKQLVTGKNFCAYLTHGISFPASLLVCYSVTKLVLEGRPARRAFLPTKGLDVCDLPAAAQQCRNSQQLVVECEPHSDPDDIESHVA